MTLTPLLGMTELGRGAPPFPFDILSRTACSRRRHPVTRHARPEVGVGRTMPAPAALGKLFALGRSQARF
jgi:hypothetical protein